MSFQSLFCLGHYNTGLFHNGIKKRINADKNKTQYKSHKGLELKGKENIVL